jgi:hypothetical protein
VDNGGNTYIYDAFSFNNCTQYGRCKYIDTDITPSAINSIACVTGSAGPAGTTVTFRRPIIALDKYDYTLPTGLTLTAYAVAEVMFDDENNTSYGLPWNFSQVNDYKYLHFADCTKNGSTYPV